MPLNLDFQLASLGWTTDLVADSVADLVVDLEADFGYLDWIMVVIIDHHPYPQLENILKLIE